MTEDSAANETGSVTRSHLVLMIAYTLRGVCAIATTAILGRYLSAEDFGFFALVVVVFTMTHIVIDFGTGQIAAREIAREPSRERPLLEGLMAFRRLAGCLLGTGFVVASLFTEEPGRSSVLVGIGAVLCFMGSSAYYPIFQVRQAQGSVAIASVAGQIFVVLGGLALIAARVTGGAFGWLVVAREAIYLSLLSILGRRLLGYRPRPGWRGRQFRPFMNMASIQGLATLAYASYAMIDAFMVQGLLGDRELGAYAAAFRLVNPALMLPTLFMIPLLPVHSTSAREAPELFRRQIANAAGVLIGLGALGAVIGLVLSHDLVALAYGGAYLEGELQTVSALRWLILGLATVFATTAYTNALIANRREATLMLLACVGLVLNVGGNFALLPLYGFTVAAILTCATEALVGLGAMWAHMRVHGVGGFRRGQLTLLLPALIAGAGLSLLESTPLVRVACGVIVGGLGAFAILTGAPARRFRREAVAP